MPPKPDHLTNNHDWFLQRCDWAWQEAREYHSADGPPDDNRENHWVRAAWQHMQCPPSSKHAAPTPLAQTIDLRNQAGLLRACLEARVLTGSPLTSVAKRCGLPLGVVQAYCGLFFDVRSRLRFRGWVVNCAVEQLGTDHKPEKLGNLLRRIGFFGGSVALEHLIAYVASLLKDPVPIDPQVTLSDSHKRAMRRCLALELLPQDKRTTLLVLHLHGQLIATKQTEPAIPRQIPTDDWLQHVCFAVTDDTISASLSAEWSPYQSVVA